jgi:C6 transcription factor Pro1
LRRKKCDEKKPTCSICGALEITCLYSDKKPEWMDGGEGERKMADHLKAMVKAKANERRERKWAAEIEADAPEKGSAAMADSDNMLASSMLDHTLESRNDHESSHSSSESFDTPGTVATEDSGSARASSDGLGATATLEPSQPVSAEVANSSQAGTYDSPLHTKHSSDDNSERELGFSMIYLDYVFPYMFPFYSPRLLMGGRGWILVLLMRNKPLYHTALSLASFFFSVVVNTSALEHSACQENNWNELQRQQELSIKSLQNSMQFLTSRGISACFHESIKCLEGIIQLLSFDATIGNANNWIMHLEAASSLFEQINKEFGTDNARPWYSILAGMDPLTMSIELTDGEHPWASNQASWRFLTINLLWTDIIASTALERTPRLARFHQELLVGDKPELRGSEFLGCQNWIILIISEIASLHAWKKEMRKSRALSMVELVKKASCIEKRLQAGIAELDSATTNLFWDPHDPSARAPDQPFAGSGFEAITEIGRLRSSTSQAFHTRIWARAALTYLTVVVSGFQPALPDIETNVVETIELLRRLPSPLCLRTFAWPFAVTGCLSLSENEEFFRSLVNNMGPMQVFGTVKEALQIMNTVWEHRSCIDADMWDISTCLNVLGHSSLLI